MNLDVDPRFEVGSAGGLYADEAEEDVVGGIMLAGSYTLDEGVTACRVAYDAGLRPEHFYSASLAFIYATLVELENNGQPVDALALTAEVERRALANVANGIVTVDTRTLRARVASLACASVSWGTTRHRARLVIGASRNREAVG